MSARMVGQRAVHGRNSMKSVEGIPVLLPLPRTGEKQPVNEVDMGKNDPDNIKYINIKASNIPSGYDDRIKEIEDMIDTTHLWLDIQAGIQVRKQTDAGKLPTDMSSDSQLRRSNYRSKVLDVLMSQGLCTWIALSSEDNARNRITCKKSEFHLKILEDVLDGIIPVKGMTEGIEGVFRSFTDQVKTTEDARVERSAWAFFNVFAWDEVTKDVKGMIRIIWYTFSGEMIHYTTNKSSYTEVSTNFDYYSSNYTFVAAQWARMKEDTESFLDEYGRMKIRDPLNGGVIPV
ncbi:hypothetical protein M426DRAFT_14563 [Hypoxylon sp. CI-4A]|nr:hypothetical protein M426DRAFT_14563 [Hypoxylon sp. CI-4A]